MPRKPKPGPAILAIESLSTGQPIGLVDDFTNEPIASMKPDKALPTADEIMAKQHKAKAEAALRLLQATGIVRPTDDARHAPKPQLASNQRMLGDSLVITMSKQPFRRI